MCDYRIQIYSLIYRYLSSNKYHSLLNIYNIMFRDNVVLRNFDKWMHITRQMNAVDVIPLNRNFDGGIILHILTSNHAHFASVSIRSFQDTARKSRACNVCYGPATAPSLLSPLWSRVPLSTLNAISALFSLHNFPYHPKVHASANKIRYFMANLIDEIYNNVI